MVLLFQRNQDIKKNAYPNWMSYSRSSSEFATYSEMYKKSGDILIDSIEENFSCKADEVIIPCILLYRHSSELILKAILLTHYLMDNNMTREKIEKKLDTHKLMTLWNRADDIICKYIDKDMRKYMRSVIEELDLIDPTSTMFRYPFDKRYEKAQLIGDEERNYRIDYTALKEEFNKAYNCFISYFYYIYEIYDSSETIRVLCAPRKR